MVDKIGKSVVRTIVPVVVGLIVSYFAKIHVSADQKVVTDLVTTVVTGGYYSLARFLEARVNPDWGWLLGAKGAPKYVDPVKAKIDLAVREAVAKALAEVAAKQAEMKPIKAQIVLPVASASAATQEPAPATEPVPAAAPAAPEVAAQ